ncbi:hypothetical protein, partial [Moorena sp. SIO1G6]|uniref:hypothetical protein n=1 Tax=Moorena sp. SIO1G6 TaxID=2607840 RepID=UPI00257AD5A8
RRSTRDNQTVCAKSKRGLGNKFLFGLTPWIESRGLRPQDFRSEIRSVSALSRLWFILAVATLYVTAQGVEVVETGKRRWVDTHWFRGNSYFRIGIDWVKSSLENGWRLIRRVRFTSNHDPDPTMASRKQHEKRSYQLEFKIQTYHYAVE